MWFKRAQRDGQVDWLVACLGNPGEKYKKTRHNVGFMTADALAAQRGVRLDKTKFKALYGIARFGGEKALIVKPQTFMNLSGNAVRAMADYYKVPVERILVVSDDTALPPGRLRIRRNGSAGGHNGLKSVISSLGTEDFPRVKIGVGAPPHPEYDLADWVLGGFSEQEMRSVADAVARAGQAVEDIIDFGVDSAMNKYNG